jgi:thioredoxin 1
MSDVVRELNELDFDSAILESPGPALVDFTAEWCPPCRALSPVVERVAVEMGHKVRFYRVDADQCPSLASRFGIRGLPTLVVFTEGREVGRRLGLTNDRGVRELVSSVELNSPRRDATG